MTASELQRLTKLQRWKNASSARTQQLREKNQQMEEELQMARELQIALLPQQFPTVPPNVSAQESALRFLSLYFFLPVTCGGDFFSVFPLGETATGVLICDVMDMASALLSSPA